LPSEGGGAVGPLHTFGDHAGEEDQAEEAGLSLHRVHLCRFAQRGLWGTGVACGLWEQPTDHMPLSVRVLSVRACTVLCTHRIHRVALTGVILWLRQRSEYNCESAGRRPG